MEKREAMSTQHTVLSPRRVRPSVSNSSSRSSSDASSRPSDVLKNELADYSPRSEALSLSDEEDDDDTTPEDLDDEMDIHFNPGDTVWVKSKNAVRETWYLGKVQNSTREGTVRGGRRGVFYSVRYYRNVRRYCAPLLGDIKPNTLRVRRLLEEAGCDIETEPDGNDNPKLDAPCVFNFDQKTTGSGKAAMSKNNAASSSMSTEPVPIIVPSPLRSTSSDSSLSSTASETPADDDSYSQASTSPRLVRFNERCVLIPECNGKSAKQQPRIGTLDLPIPIGIPWRWPATSPAKEKKEKELFNQDAGLRDSTVSKSPEMQHVVLKVPFPIFRRKSHSSIQTLASCPLPPCLVHRPSSLASPRTKLPSASSSTQPSPSQKRVQSRSRPKRSASLPPFSSDKDVETIPLRPCCAQCQSACETHLHTLPPLKESSREGSPSLTPTKRQSRLHVHESPTRANVKDIGEDWCAGLHFTKGALKLRRSASVEHGAHSEQESEALLGALVSVDEVDRKRSMDLPPTPPASARGLKSTLAVSIPDFDRVKGSASGEELFPLPSPKRSPSATPIASPADSALYLPGQLTSTEPRKLEAAIKAKMADRRERERAKSAADAASTPAIVSAPIPVPKSKAGSTVVSHFQSHTDEIVYDPSSPDPDALPAGSAILLNSPPSSPPTSAYTHTSTASASPPSLYLHPPEPLSLSAPDAASPLLDPHSQGRTARRRSSLTSIMLAGVSVLRGISLSTPAGQDGAATGYTRFNGGMVV
ncbi:hypothetical protein DFH11DRAFT_1879818 [Phellopilus nigrolimitatus]|nr:hypothetical protein DFH11DRAFT_1879818 [Phellopilus nigrolimitatus]